MTSSCGVSRWPPHRFAAIQWEEGARHGFPACCRAQWIVDGLLPRFPGDFGGRLRRLFRPRYAVADGMVPCAFHALAFVATGDRSGWRRGVVADGACCDHMRIALAGHLVWITVETAPEAGLPHTAWFVGVPDGENCSVRACPWCSEPVDERLRGVGPGVLFVDGVRTAEAPVDIATAIGLTDDQLDALEAS